MSSPRRNPHSTQLSFECDYVALLNRLHNRFSRTPQPQTAAPPPLKQSLHRPAPRTRSLATLIPLLRPLDRRKELLSHISPVSSTALILALQYLRFTSAVPTFCDRSPFLCRRADFLCRRANFFCRRSTHAVRPQHPPTRAYRRPDSPIPPPKSAAPSCPVLPPQPDSFATTSRPAFDSTFWSKESQTGSQGQPDLIKGGAALDQRNAADRSYVRPDLTTRGFSKVPQGFPAQAHRLFGDPHRLVAPSLRGRSDRQSGRNRSSYSLKPITRETQTLHKGRSEIVQGRLKTPTGGANPQHRTGFAQFCVRRKPTAFKEIRPSRRPVPPFRPRNPPHADFSFRPTDFLVQDYRLFGDPYRLFLLRLRGHSDESYGPRSARFPNFFRYRVNQTSRSSPCPPALSRRQMRIFGIITADDACLSR